MSSSVDVCIVHISALANHHSLKPVTNTVIIKGCIFLQIKLHSLLFKILI